MYEFEMAARFSSIDAVFEAAREIVPDLTLVELARIGSQDATCEEFIRALYAADRQLPPQETVRQICLAARRQLRVESAFLARHARYRPVHPRNDMVQHGNASGPCVPQLRKPGPVVVPP